MQPHRQAAKRHSNRSESPQANATKHKGPPAACLSWQNTNYRICGLVHLAPVWASAVPCLPSRLHQGRREEHRDSEQRWRFSLESRFSWKPSLGGFPECHLDPSDPCCVFSIIELVLPPPFPVSLAPGTNPNQRPGDTLGSLSITPLSSWSPSPVDLISQIKPKYLHLSSPSSWLLAELLHNLLLGLRAPVSPSSIHFHKAAESIVGFHAATKGLLLGKSPVLSMAYKALWGLPPPTSPCPPGRPVPHPSQEEHGPVLWCSSLSPWLSPLPLPTSSWLAPFPPQTQLQCPDLGTPFLVPLTLTLLPSTKLHRVLGWHI